MNWQSTPDQLNGNAVRGALFGITNGVLDVPHAVDVVIDYRVRVAADVYG